MLQLLHLAAPATFIYTSTCRPRHEPLEAEPTYLSNAVKH